MKFTDLTRLLVLALAAVVLSGCNTIPPEDPYIDFRQNMPKSILVFPPANESVDVRASYSWLTTATRPIAEQGFYVFPVAIVDEFMKENGLSQPEEMHTAPLDKISEIFGADAVLYVTIEDYGQKFQLVSSVTTVRARAELVDVKSGLSLWDDRVDYTESSSDSSNSGLLGAVVSAAIAQVGESLNDSAHHASRLANQELFVSGRHGLLLGPAHPGFEQQAVDAAARAVERQEAIDAAAMEASADDAADATAKEAESVAE